jgi:hypothetical protein
MCKSGPGNREWTSFHAGVRMHSIGLGERAKKANPLRGAVKPGTEPGLEATRMQFSGSGYSGCTHRGR